MDSAPLTQTQLLRLVAKRLLVIIPALFALIFASPQGRSTTGKPGSIWQSSLRP